MYTHDITIVIQYNQQRGMSLSLIISYVQLLQCSTRDCCTIAKVFNC